jgi:hypothetical protein
MPTDPITPDDVTPVLADVAARLADCEHAVAELSRSNSIARHNADSALQAFALTNDRLNQLAVRVDAVERPPVPARQYRAGIVALGEDLATGRATIVAVHEAIPRSDGQMDVHMTITLKPVSSGS